MKKFFEKDSVLKIISLFIAFLVWLYVIYIEDPEVTITVDDIPVSYKITELPESLSLVDYEVKTVDVKISGTRSKIIDFEDDEITANLDLSVISESGKYDNVKINIGLSNKNIEIIESSEKKSLVQIDDVISSSIDVSAKLSGEPKEGYVVSEKPILFVDSVRVSGAKTFVEMVDSAYIKIDCDGMNESKTVSSNVILVDKDGNDINKKHKAYKHLTIGNEEISAYVTVSEVSPIEE